MTYHSQIGQDQYYIENISKGKRNGIFLDIGANSGIFESNTATLEFEYGWTGVCVEANPKLIEELSKNRPNSTVVECAVWNSNGEIEFETTNSNLRGIQGHLLSRISNTGRNDQYFNEHFDEDKSTFIVPTRTITDILKQYYEFPCVIDYCSIDTEGAELESLQGIDFNQIDIKFITIEHGCRPKYMEKFEKHLAPYGYHIHRINQWDVEFVK